MNNRRKRGADAHRAGLAAEETAARLYVDAGAAILARRWRCAAGEIDLIVREGDEIVFVEVKARAAATDVDGPIRPAQSRRLEKAAETYILSALTGDAKARFDLVLVDGTGAAEIIRNARG